MNAKTAHFGLKPILWLAVGLALLTALFYILIAQGMLSIGDLTQAEGPDVIIYIAAVCYFAGGLLILAQRRWLWAVGAAINGLVVTFFLRLYQDRPSVLFSPGGLASKAAQILLEVALIYLIFIYSRRSVGYRSS